MTQHAQVQHNFVTQTQLTTQHKKTHPDHPDFKQLIDEKAFIQSYPSGTEDAATLRKRWRHLMGFHPGLSSQAHTELRADFHHPKIQYLTESALTYIKANIHHFELGIDYKRLPLGFVIIKNANEGGIRNILHFYPELLEEKRKHHPLSLSIPSEDETPFAASQPDLTQERYNSVRLPQSTLFFFLKTIQAKANPRKCSDRFLDKALRHFFNTLEKLELLEIPLPLVDLHYDETLHPDDPVLLLSRWEQILNNPRLNRENRERQWSVLPKLPCRYSYQVIRILDESSPSFMIPEMKPNQVVHQSGNYFSYCTLERRSDISILHDGDLSDPSCPDSYALSLRNFWRYVSFHGSVLSIKWYEQAIFALEKIQAIKQTSVSDAWSNFSLFGEAETQDESSTPTLNPVSRTDDDEAMRIHPQVIESEEAFGKEKRVKQFLLTLLAGGTCKKLKGLSEEESHHLLNEWNKLCQFIQENLSDLVATENTLRFVLSLNKRPDLKTCKWIIESLIQFETSHALTQLRTYEATHRNESYLKASIEAFGKAFIKGKTLFSMKNAAYLELTYFLLNYEIETYSPSKKKAICRLLSHFNLDNQQKIEAVLIRLSSFNNERALNFCSQQLSALNTTQSIESFYSLIEGLEQCQNEENTIPKWIDQLQRCFGAQHELQSLEKIRQDYYRLQNDLSPTKNWFLSYNFSNQAEHALIEFFNTILKRNQIPSFPPNELILSIYRVFIHLSENDFIHLLTMLELLTKDLNDRFESLQAIFKEVAEIKTLSLIEHFYQTSLSFKNQDNPDLLKKLLTFHQFLSHHEALKFCESDIGQLFATLCLRSNADFSVKDLSILSDKLLSVLDYSLNAKPLLIEILSQFSTEPYLPNIIKLIESIEALKKLATNIDEASYFFYTIISHFRNTPQNFLLVMATLEKLERVLKIDKVNQLKRNFLLYATHLLNERLAFTSFSDLCDKYALAQTQLKTEIELILTSLPVVPIETLIQWIQNTSIPITECYDQFSLTPYGERRNDYQFSIDRYRLQAPHFQGCENLFTESLGMQLEEKLKDNRNQSTRQLNQRLASTKMLENDQVKILDYLCLAIEYLARTCSQADGSHRISQELNTTQVMSLCGMLLLGRPKILNQIDTGEGKSRILMILCAVNALCGYTIDFLTSNYALTLRDYLAYHAFFDALGIPVNCIHLGTLPSDYLRREGKQGAVNFSDQSQLLLLRNRTRLDWYHGNLNAASGQAESYSDLPEKRCLILDEEDAFRVGQASHPYNYAISSEFYREHEWVYAAILEYTRESLKPGQEKLPSAYNIYEFQSFINSKDPDDLHQMQVARLVAEKPIQLGSWIESAKTALTMRAGVDYVTTPDNIESLRCKVDVSGSKRYGREVLVLDHGRPAEGSCFSNGIHQFLILIESEKSRYPFVFDAETNLVSTSYPQSFLACYDRIFGASGTTRHELSTASQSKFHFLVTPREKPCIRQDRPALFCRDINQQQAFIRNEIANALKHHHPVLLICKDEREAQTLYARLTNDQALNYSHIQLVHSLSSKDEEAQAIETAATPGTLTLSTSMFSRGVDIKADHLFVITTSIQSRPDQQQTFGRAGRFGLKGKTRPILNLSDPTMPLSVSHHTEQQIEDIQNNMDKMQLFNTEMLSIYADFLEKLHLTFFATPIEKRSLELLQTWQTFLINLQAQWELNRITFLGYLEAKQTSQFSEQFANFFKWAREQFTITFGIELEAASTLTLEPKPRETLSTSLAFFQEKKPRARLRIQTKYDLSDDGQARIYSCLFAQTRAILAGKRHLFANTRAWWQGRGVLFADLRATLNGQRPLFANLRATIEDLIRSKSNPTLSRP